METERVRYPQASSIYESLQNPSRYPIFDGDVPRLFEPTSFSCEQEGLVWFEKAALSPAPESPRWIGMNYSETNTFAPRLVLVQAHNCEIEIVSRMESIGSGFVVVFRDSVRKEDLVFANWLTMTRMSPYLLEIFAVPHQSD